MSNSQGNNYKYKSNKLAIVCISKYKSHGKKQCSDSLYEHFRESSSQLHGTHMAVLLIKS